MSKTAAVLVASLALSACGQTVVPEIRLVPLRLPEALLTCEAAPPLPAGNEFLTQGQVAELLLAYDAAHADCSGRLEAVRKLNRGEE